MKISSAYPSNYLKAVDLSGRSVSVVVADCQLETLDGDSKPVLRLEGKTKRLVLNKTNSAIIASAYGDETDDWHGQEIELYADKVPFQGKIVDAIRVRIAERSESSDTADLSDDITW